MFTRSKSAHGAQAAPACVVEGCEALAAHTWRERWHIPQDDGAEPPVQLAFLLPFCDAHYRLYVERFKGQAVEWDVIPRGALAASAQQLAAQVHEIIASRDGDPLDVLDALDASEAPE